MMKKIQVINENFDISLFNQKAIHPLQSWQWGEARKKMGIEVLRLGEFENEELINIYQLTFHQIPFTSFKIGYLPRSKFPSLEVFDFLLNYCKKNKIIFVKIEPYEKEEKNFFLLKLKENYPLKISPHPLFPQWTIILDLKKNEEEILKRMKPKTRYNIRLAQKKGVVIKEMTNQKGFEIFSRLYFETCKRQKYFGHDYRYHKIIFETLKEKIAHILVAFYKNIPLAAYEIFIFNKVLYYPYGGSSIQYRNFMASNLLMWETIKFGKKNGAEIFDMWGSLPPSYNMNHPWAGFTRFKQGYGGEFIKLIGSFDLVINPYLYSLYNFAYKIRKLWFWLKK